MADVADSLPDGANWTFVLELIDPETGEPQDLTGSQFKLTLVNAVDGMPVVTASTEAEDGSLTIVAPATDGRLRFMSFAKDRIWRASRTGQLAYQRAALLVGDLLRRPDPDAPWNVEGTERIEIRVRPGTTEWLPPSP